MSKQLKGTKLITAEPVALSQRVENVQRYARITEKSAVRNMIKKVVLMPFSDFMFFHKDEYAYIMREYTQNQSRTKFPDILTGQAFEFIVNEIGKSPGYIYECEGQERRTALLNAVYAPFLRMYDCIKTDVSSPFSRTASGKEIIQESAWRYVNDSPRRSREVSVDVELPLQERIRQIRIKKSYKVEAYRDNVYHNLQPSEAGRMFFGLLYGATFQDYYDSLCSLSYTKLSPTKITYSKLLQSETEFSLDKPLMEYYEDQSKTDFKLNLYSIFIYPMAQVSHTMYTIYLKRVKQMKANKK